MTSMRAPALAEAGRGSVRQLLDRGLHPATRVPLLDTDLVSPSAVCGGCTHGFRKQLGAGKEPRERLKCGLLPRGTRGLRGPDLRDDTPACMKYAAPTP